MYKLSESLWAFNTRDLMRAASCDHCIKLGIARALDLPGVAKTVDPYKLEGKTLAMTYGDKFEAEIEAELRASLGAADFQRPEGQDTFIETIALMRAGVPVIYQGALRHNSGIAEFTGRPDFLVRGDYALEFKKGKLTAVQVEGDASGYIAWDAKLASSAKPHYLLQVALYVEALDALGLKAPNALHGLILGSRTIEQFEEGEIVPAMREARSLLEGAFELAAKDTSSFELSALTLHCNTASDCSICEYPDLCDHDRKEVDHLVQVAGITKGQIEKLKKAGIGTMAALATASDSERPAEIVAGTFEKLRNQAKLQNDFKLTGKHSYLLLDDPEIGVLPPADAADLFFDMEGFPFFEERGGLEYLFGAIDRDKKFYEFWAHDRQQESVAFEKFVKFAYQRMQQNPGAHIYHYAQYEVTALNRLATRHGVMEAEVDWLIAEGKLIDLFKVVKGSIMVSQPGYSIKKLEPLYGFGRDGEVENAGESLSEYDYYRQLTELDPPQAEVVLKNIGDYNQDDCVSTLGLYQWLSGMPGAHGKYQLHRQAVDRKKAEWAGTDDDEDRSTSKAEAELAALQEATNHMAKAVANWRWGESADGDYRALVWQALMHSVLYYKREEVTHWRERHLRREATFEALHEDRKALVVDGCVVSSEPLGELQLDPRARINIEYNYVLSEGQANLLKAGKKIYVRYGYGANQHQLDPGMLTHVDGLRVIFTRNTTVENSKFQPNAIFENGLIPAGSKQDAVRDVALSLANKWVSPDYEAPQGFAALDLLMRRPPRFRDGGKLLPVQGDDYLPAIIDAVERLDNSVLAIQGPPGSGKTYLGSHTIAHLVAQGKKIGVVANSHSAVDNLLVACLAAGVAPEQIVKKKNEEEVPPLWAHPTGYPAIANWRSKQTGGYVMGGTAWAFCAGKIAEQKFDYIFVDEAAQFSMVDAIAVSGVTRNLVLLGDPMQLTQVVQAIHPGGVDNSALGHYMGEQHILDSEHGYFVEVTRRMNPAVNAPVSWLSYQNRLHSHASASAYEIAGQAPGFVPVPVEHLGNGSHSPEEIDKVLELTKELVSKVGQEQVLIVAPYNAQVDMLRLALDSSGFSEVQVGTVDKFQGREALAVIISLAASTAIDAPRGLEFLLDRNRLNVALSRAKANSYLVFSPLLRRTRWANVEDVRAVSRLVGLLDFALPQ